jgi:CRISPR system Cascade subunit CasC
MFVELHILQNFAPANLNRDDTGSPKDCEFGGFRRARVSSQCWKRAIRTAFRDEGLIPASDRAIRTKRVLEEVVKRLAARGRDEEGARPRVIAALASVELTVKEDGKTEYLLFLGEREIAALADACEQWWDALTPAAPPTGEAGPKPKKKAAKDSVPAEVKNALGRLFDGGRAADLALFGRMLADMPERNIDAAAQVAHAISTNRVSMEFDFYTAVDDLNSAETAGAGMMGTIEFNSACFYRYANVDLRQLTANVGGDAALGRNTLEAFLRASISAIPSGKQNSMAAQSWPSLVFAVVRDRGLCSLANAFVQPVRPGESLDIIENSVLALDRYWQRMDQMYGAAGVRARAVCTDYPGALEHLAADRVDSVERLIAVTQEALA